MSRVPSEIAKLPATGRSSPTEDALHDLNNFLSIAIANLELLCEQLSGETDGGELAREALAAVIPGAGLTLRLVAPRPPR